MTRLLRCMGAVGLCLLSAVHPSAFAQQPERTTYNPVEKASFHQLLFADEDLDILNNLYPPKADSGFHAHHRDLFAVIIQASPSSIQNLGKPLAPGPLAPAGTALYGPVGPEPRVHRGVNDGAGPYQIIVVEVRRPKPSGTAVASREGAPPYEQILDNPRMRAWRLVLVPGQSAPAITQVNKGVRIVVRGGLLATTSPGLQDQLLALRPGDVAVQPAGTTRALKNAGTGTIELVELELK